MTNPLLAGIRVLDLSRLLPGPFCSLYLAQLGAEVIKIEEPDGGDYARSLAPDLFGLVNRGKKSVTLDLRKAEDQQTFHDLVGSADIVLETFRPGVMDRLNCGYETLKAINPRIVYCSISGYGWTGPWRDFAGHDLNYLSTAGVMDQIGTVGGPPVQAGVQIADIAGGSLSAAIGILAAVVGAQKSGVGCMVDVSMTDCSMALQVASLSALRTQGAMPPRGDDMLTGALPNYRMYKCRDGKYFALGSLEPKFFKGVLKGLWETSPDALQTAVNPVLKLASKSSSGESGGSKDTLPI
ncbi:MAG TPA: CaiB/BaiF CoA-transferase family protein, partial [Nevskiaceae bacterium]|nr:CaiB/BaiF CoA-transferase family protein [Nevskiaceae bacterium]